ncbi:MAG: hypothetical protein COB10_11495 [Planctomycetota bacterium]|nr:MAG: hypothetical protein COB10_11495 [Planctomycetota bacterium]
MKNLPMLLVAGGAAIVGLSFFMGKGEDADDNITEIDAGKAKHPPPMTKRPGNLNVTTEVRIVTVSAIYS